ncbi:MAG: hypothetical protein LBP61_00675 [Desulfovibrio sp.]|jgi:hypothetical protein|nr:hypothetical protein [Desulfovibrio sp.]
MKTEQETAGSGRWPRHRPRSANTAAAQQQNGPRFLLRLLWWAGYIIAALFLQQQFPGLDALTSGFLLALQERKTVQTLWLFLLFVLVQEGAGNLHFGMAMLWYGGQVLIFRLSSRLFVADNILFVIILSASLGGYYGLLLWFMCVLQDVPLDYALLLRASLFQALAIPLIWSLIRAFSLRSAGHAH